MDCRRLIYLIYVIIGTTATPVGQDKTRTKYRAAVYSHAVTSPDTIASNHSQAVRQMMVNLQEFKKQATIASADNVDIIVFPEYGITGFVRDRTDMSHYIENIPDVEPGKEWIPCDDPTRFSQRLDVVIFLSCLARNNTMYIVANYGDVKPCQYEDPNCPDDGQYQYNTNVVFDKKGAFIARYHKQNLYNEKQFNEPIDPEHVFFDTSFGRFGTFTCFDILFYEPMIPLITEHKITDVAFPTAWMDALPHLSAIGYHSSVPLAYHVNLLSANIHLPEARFQGSGIYTPGGANAFYYSRSSPDGKLLISDVNVATSQFTGKCEANECSGRNQILANTNTSLARVHKNYYNIVPLTKHSDSLTVCQNDLCCFIEYEKERNVNDLYAFGVYSGRHKGNLYYIQNCILFRCAATEISSCGELTFSASTKFAYLKINGSFGHRYVTPQIVLTDNGALRLPPKGMMTYENGELTGRNTPYPVLEACLFGRVYDKDPKTSDAGTTFKTPRSTFYFIILGLFYFYMV